MKVVTYVINKGTSTQYYGLKNEKKKIRFFYMRLTTGKQKRVHCVGL